MVFLRYFLAGGMATTVHYAALLALVELASMPPAGAAVVGTLCGAAAAYGLNRLITFAASTASHQRAIPRFVLVAAAGAAFNGGVVWCGTQWLGWHYLAVQALASALVLGLTYRLNRSWTFAQ